MIPRTHSRSTGAGVYRGNHIHRMPVIGKRINYRTLKKGAIKKLSFSHSR